MTNIKELRTGILAELNKLTSNKVYFVKVPDTAVYPYIVYDINTNEDDEGNNVASLTIDFWDNKQDTTALYTMIGTVNAGINRAVITTSSYSLVLYLDTKFPIDDVEPNINRVQHNYTGRFYNK